MLGSKLKKVILYLLDLFGFIFLIRNVKKIIEFIGIALIPITTWIAIVNGSLLIAAFIFWKVPDNWYFPFRDDKWTDPLDRILLLAGVIISLRRLYKKF